MWIKPSIGESVIVRSLTGRESTGTIYAVYQPTHKCGVRLPTGCIVANWWQVMRPEPQTIARRKPVWKRLAAWIAG